MEATPRQAATSAAARHLMKSRRWTHQHLADALDMNINTMRGRLSGRARWTPDEMDRLVLLGAEVPALGMTEAVGE